MKFRLYFLLLSLFLTIGIAPTYAEDAEEDVTPETTYVDLSPPFIINLGNKSAPTDYLKTDIQLAVGSEELSERVAFHSAPIRHELLMLIGSKSKEELQSVEVRQELLTQALTKINEHLDSLEKGVKVDEILFTSFILQ